MSETPQEIEGRDEQTRQEVARFLWERYSIQASSIVLSGNREYAFFINTAVWQKIDLIDGWTPHDAVPGCIPAGSIEQFYDWLEEDRDKAHRKGRRMGENAMRAAIRNLIGAASLVDLDVQE